MLSATFDDRGGGANDPAFSVDLTRSRAIFRDPEILYIITELALPLREILIPVFHTGVSSKLGNYPDEQAAETQH